MVLRGELKPTNFKDYFHQYFTVATKGVGTRNRPSSRLQLGVSDPEQILKTSRKIRRGGYQVLAYEAKCKDSYVFFMTEL